MSRARKSSLRIVAAEAPRMSLISADAMNDLDMKLAQIRAITDLIQTADTDGLFEHTIENAAYTVGVLVDECETLLGSRKLAQVPADELQP
jgi:hypothetical protein